MDKHRSPLLSVVFNQQLSSTTLDFIQENLTFKVYKKGEQILWQQDQIQSVIVVINGFVKVYRQSKDGREQILSIFKRGSFINTVSAFSSNERNRANVKALSKTELGLFSRIFFKQLITNYPDFSQFLLEDFARKLEKMSKLVEDLSLYSTSERLYHFLLDQTKKDDVIRGWTQGEIAAQVGTVRDVVSRLLNKFARQGIIKIERQKIAILDRERIFNEDHAY